MDRLSGSRPQLLPTGLTLSHGHGRSRTIQTVMLRLNTFIDKANQLLFTIRTFQDSEHVSGQMGNSWLPLSLLLKLTRTEVCIRLCTYITAPYILYEGIFFFFLVMLRCCPRGFK